MQSQNTDLQVRQPETLWQRPLKADLKGLFKAATKALVHLGTAKPYDILSDVGEVYSTLLGMEQKDIMRVLEEIGLAVWHGDSRTTTISAIITHCNNANITRHLEKFSEGAEKGVTRLLTAFYFRQYGDTPTGDKTFEFTHKSFGESLTSLRIVRGLERIYRERRNHEQDSDSGWDVKHALKHWAELCGPTPIDKYLLSFLRAEVALADLISVDLTYANLSDADLSNAMLVRADLSGANLNGANLSGSEINGAELNGANWWNANPASFEGEKGYELLRYLKEAFPIPQESRQLSLEYDEDNVPIIL